MILLVIALNLPQLWNETNSHAATARGMKSFQQQKCSEAAAAFAQANRVAPTPQRAFNLGTAQIASGNREQGSTTLARAMEDRQFRADALFNRGNSALAANAFDYAIHDYVEALKLQPGDAAAKRNLEIALVKKRSMQRQSGGSRQNQQGSSPRQQPRNPEQPSQDPKQRSDQENVDALLRSVQQQEQEELLRMHRAKPEKLHVGW